MMRTEPFTADYHCQGNGDVEPPPEHEEGCDCDECAHDAVVDTFSGADAHGPRCPSCGAGMDSLELDEDAQRAFCGECATEGSAEDAIHAGVEAAREQWMVTVDGGCLKEGDDALDRWAAMTRARTLRIEHPDGIVAMVLLRDEEVTR